MDTQSKVVIVGNSPIILENEYGSLIDSYDIVIRINKCTTKGFEKYIGSKINIWATTHPEYHKNPLNHKEIFTPDNDKNIQQIWKRTPGVTLKKLPKHYSTISCFTMYKTEKFKKNKIFSEYDKRLNPQKKTKKKMEMCTGLLTILSSTLFFSNVTVTGFSFYNESKKTTAYYKEKELDKSGKHIEDKFWRNVEKSGFASKKNALIKKGILEDLVERKLINIL